MHPDLPELPELQPADSAPLGLSLGAIIFCGFMLIVTLAGIGTLARGGRGVAPGIVLTVVGLALLADGILLLQRRSFVAWVVAVAVLALIALSYVVAAVVAGTIGTLVYVFLFVPPIMLLCLPGTRDALRR